MPGQRKDSSTSAAYPHVKAEDRSNGHKCSGQSNRCINETGYVQHGGTAFADSWTADSGICRFQGIEVVDEL